VSTLVPFSQREKQISNSLGCEGWEVVERRAQVIVLNSQPGVLIAKQGHMRWVRPNQVCNNS
jgi:hypothetical protein